MASIIYSKKPVANKYVIKLLKEAGIYGKFIETLKIEYKDNPELFKHFMFCAPGCAVIDEAFTWIDYPHVEWNTYYYFIANKCRSNMKEYMEGFIYA